MKKVRVLLADDHTLVRAGIRSLLETLKTKTERELRGSLHRLSAEEAAVLALLQQHMEHQLGGRRRRVSNKGARAKRPKARRKRA